jgi:hypothetical protein
MLLSSFLTSALESSEVKNEQELYLLSPKRLHGV